MDKKNQFHNRSQTRATCHSEPILPRTHMSTTRNRILVGFVFGYRWLWPTQLERYAGNGFKLDRWCSFINLFSQDLCLYQLRICIIQFSLESTLMLYSNVQIFTRLTVLMDVLCTRWTDRICFSPCIESTNVNYSIDTLCVTWSTKYSSGRFEHRRKHV